MAFFRKRPVVIEARLFDGTWECASALLDWIVLVDAAWGDNATLVIPTLEGEHTASAGDWIIKGVKGEFYPIKPDIFAATYELVAAIGHSTP